jgi:hypothetical protein
MLAVAACCLAGLSHAQEAGPAIDQEMKASLRESFAYQPATADNPAPVKVAPDVILMQRVVVRSRWEAEGLDAAITHQEAIDDKFTLYKGGTIVGPLGTWYDPGGDGIRPHINFLKIAW